MVRLRYPNIQEIVFYNKEALELIKVKKADRHEILAYPKVEDVISTCKNKKGDVYDKAICIIKGIAQKHPFASANRRTAIITTKAFLNANKKEFKVPNNKEQSKVMQGIREDYYTDEEIRRWLKHGKIKEFKR
jgi:death-on-curing family protein